MKEAIITVTIIKCPNQRAWYRDKIGQTFKVVEHWDDRFYLLAEDVDEDPKRLIKKENCSLQ